MQKQFQKKHHFLIFFFFLDWLNHASQGNPLAVYILYIWPTRRWVNLYLHILETDITQTTFCICSQFGRWEWIWSLLGTVLSGIFVFCRKLYTTACYQILMSNFRKQMKALQWDITDWLMLDFMIWEWKLEGWRTSEVSMELFSCLIPLCTGTMILPRIPICKNLKQ